MALDPNLDQLEAVADALGPLMDELCLVGGCAAGLLISDPGASPVRPTEDVDLVVEAVQYTAYHNFCGGLAERGFFQRPDSDDPICRWRRDGLVVDSVHVASGIRALRADHLFVEAFPAYFDDGPERARIVDKRLESLCSPE